MNRALLALLLMTVLPVSSAAQTNPASMAARGWRQQHERAIVEEFIGCWRCPTSRAIEKTFSATPRPSPR